MVKSAIRLNSLFVPVSSSQHKILVFGIWWQPACLMVQMWGHHSRTNWCNVGAPLPPAIILARGSGHRLCGGPPVGGISSRRSALRGIAGGMRSGPPTGGISSRRCAHRGVAGKRLSGPPTGGIRNLCYIECRCRIFVRILPRHRPRAVPPQRNLRIRRQRPGRIHMLRNLGTCLNTAN